MIDDRDIVWLWFIIFGLLLIVAWFGGLIVYFRWKGRSRRPKEPGFEYVYVNQDGSARELSPDEQRFLSEKFPFGDSGRPYIKINYESVDGWGSLSGFIRRRCVPSHVNIGTVNPDYDVAVKELSYDPIALHRASGDVVVNNPDGSITCSPNPEMTREQRFETMRNHHLAQQQRREELAKA